MYLILQRGPVHVCSFLLLGSSLFWSDILRNNFLVILIIRAFPSFHARF